MLVNENQTHSKQQHLMTKLEMCGTRGTRYTVGVRATARADEEEA